MEFCAFSHQIPCCHGITLVDFFARFLEIMHFLCSGSAHSFQVLMDLSESLNLLVGVCLVFFHFSYPGCSEGRIFSITSANLLIEKSLHVYCNWFPQFDIFIDQSSGLDNNCDTLNALLKLDF